MIEYSNISDSELVKLCKSELPNSEYAFDEFIERYKNYVFYIAYEKLKNQEDAEDATQETFVRVYFGIQNFRGDSEFKTWLTRIVQNVCMTVLLTRKRKFWKYHISLNGEADLEGIYASTLSTKQETNFWQHIGRILRRMTFIYRKVFIFKYFKNFSLFDISVKTKTTLAATKMKVKRAKEQFLKIFMSE